MAIDLTEIEPNDPISQGPAVLNDNFNLIEEHIDDIEDLLNTSNNTLRLTSVATVPTGGIEASALTATKSSGDVIVIAPSGGPAVYKVTAEGKVTALNVTATGNGADRSVIEELNIPGGGLVEGDFTIDAALLLNGDDSIVVNKSTVISITDNNIGTNANNLVDISAQQIVYLDYHNSGNALPGDADVKLDTTNFRQGQKFRVQCFRDNASGMRIWNGTSGSPIFAFIDPTGNGYQEISASVKPEFLPGSSPDTRSYFVAQWTDIGGGNMRLVVLDHENMNNVS